MGRPKQSRRIELQRQHRTLARGNAVPEGKEKAHYTTKAMAGHGAMCKAIELILKSKDVWNSIINNPRA